MRVYMAPNPWDKAFEQISKALQYRNEQDRLDKEAADANTAVTDLMGGLLGGNKSFTTTTLDGKPMFNTDYATAPLNTQFGQTPGLLNGLAGDVKLNYTPPVSAAPAAPAPVTPTATPAATPAVAPAQDTTTPATTAAVPAQAPSRFQTTTKDWNTVRGAYWQDASKQLKDLQGRIGARAFAQVRGQLMQQIKDGETQLKTDYETDKTKRGWEAFNAETDPRKKIQLAVLNGLDRESAKWILDPGMDTQMINVNDKWVMVGKDKFTGQYIDPQTKQPIDPNILKMGVSATDQMRDSTTRYVHDTPSGSSLVAANAATAGLSPGEKRALDASNAVINGFHSRWKDPITGDLRQGYQSDPGYAAYQNAIQVQGAFLPRIGGQGGQKPDLPRVPKTGDSRIDAMADNMRAKGATEQQVNDMVWEEQNKPRPASRPMVSDDEQRGAYMGSLGVSGDVAPGAQPVTWSVPETELSDEQKRLLQLYGR
jgi:hypothetical protein